MALIGTALHTSLALNLLLEIGSGGLTSMRYVQPLQLG